MNKPIKTEEDMEKQYQKKYVNKIIQGDCLKIMKTIEDNSIDTIITDPPYGLKFMGKKWDYNVPSIEIWKECLRVLKPGGTALIFAGSRTQHRMACNVEDAGFILKDCIMWLYGSGFPKATDISKQLDKGVERKVVRMRTDGNKGGGAKTYDDDNYIWDKPFAETEPSTPEAKLWNGWKSHGLKPAYEPILVAVKPNEGTYANNALKWGVSGLNIDGGRIGLNIENDPNYRPNASKHKGHGSSFSIQGDKQRNKNDLPDKGFHNSKGRFPANIIHDGSDEVVGLFPDTKNTARPNCINNNYGQSSNIKMGGGQVSSQHNDSGSASRFFYCAKASKSERNFGCEELFILKDNVPEKDLKKIKHLLSI